MKDIIITLLFIGFWIFISFSIISEYSIEANESEKAKNIFIIISVIGFFMMITGFILLIVNWIFN